MTLWEYLGLQDEGRENAIKGLISFLTFLFIEHFNLGGLVILATWLCLLVFV